MLKTRRLLVFDQNRETGEVLKAVLETPETQVTAVRSWQQLGQCEPNQQGTVLVVRSQEWQPEDPQVNRLEAVPRVVIGRLCATRIPQFSTDSAVLTTEAGENCHFDNSEKSLAAEDSAECCLDDMFEYPDLVSAIQRLWNRAG